MAEAQARTPSSDFSEWCAWRWLQEREEQERQKRTIAGRKGQPPPPRAAQTMQEQKNVMMAIAALQATKYGRQ